MTEPDLPAGAFSAWLRATRMAHLEDCGMVVPCGGCSACCRSSYFVHVGPGETGTLASIPGELLFTAPDLPKGTMLMGYDDQGRCPMLLGDACSIYEQRPLTCRTYDCRVYAAAGIDADRLLISARARRWTFDYPTVGDRDRHAAVRRAARFLQKHAECFPGGAVPGDPAQVAVLAIKVYEIFVHGGASRKEGRARTDRETAKAVMKLSEEFHAQRAATPDTSKGK